MVAETTLLAWHWMPADRRLRLGEPIVVEPGAVLEAVGPLRLCENGMHACPRAVDSLRYRYGPVLSRVELRGEMLGPDADGKACARGRVHLWMASPERATRVLDEWFHWVTERVLTRRRDAGLGVLDQEWAALRAVAAWLDGSGTRKEMGAAAWAARDARDAEANEEMERRQLALAPTERDAARAAEAARVLGERGEQR